MTSLQDWQLSVAWIVFVATYGVLALGYVPWFRLDRAGATFVGAVAMVACGVLTEGARPVVVMDFWSYTRIGLPVTTFTMVMGLLYWQLRYGL